MSLRTTVFAACGLLALSAMPLAAPAQAQVAGPALDQVFYHGRLYCFYAEGWHGPGWYWCGYAFRRGLGFGGPNGWHGFRRGFERFRGRRGVGHVHGRIGGRFGGAHPHVAGHIGGRMGGRVGGHMGGGHMGGGHMGGGHMGGGHMGGGHMGGGHMGGGHMGGGHMGGGHMGGGHGGGHGHH